MGRYLMAFICIFFAIKSAQATEVKSIEPANILSPTNQITLTGHIIGLSSRIRSETGEFEVLIADDLRMSATSSLDLATLTVDNVTATELYADDTLHYATVEYIGGNGGRVWTPSTNIIYERQSGTSRHGIDLDNGDVLLGGRLISTLTGGATRGSYAVDLQQSRSFDSQVASGDHSSIIGGENNTASGDGSVVGGYDNTASGIAAVTLGYLNVSSGTTSAVVGGRNNSATAEESFVGGGDGNTASGAHSTVAGGENNTASGQESTVSGGSGNTASGGSSYVAGGVSNTASGALSTSLGGFLSVSSGQYSTCLGGFGPDATGDYSTTMGGYAPLASGAYSIALGGYDNRAIGDYSIAAGRLSVATHDYSIVISADPSGATSTATGEITLSAPNGVRFIGGALTLNDTPVGSAGGGGGCDCTPIDTPLPTTTPIQTMCDVDGVLSAVFSGRDNDIVDSNYSVISGGDENEIGVDSVDADYGFIGGGYQNGIKFLYTSVVGGRANLGYSQNSFIGGGWGNTTNWDYGVIVGGVDNNITTSAIAAILSGDNCTASGHHATVINGEDSVAGGDFSIAAGETVAASGDYSMAIGHESNASGDYSVAIGSGCDVAGDTSFTGGLDSSAPGAIAIAYGYQCLANSTYTYAFGRQANAAHDGAFVYADKTTGTDPIASTANNQATFRVRGGFRVLDGDENPGEITYADQVYESGYTRVWDATTNVVSENNSTDTVYDIDLDNGSITIAGAIQSTHSGGNARGTNAVDLQVARHQNPSVASGELSGVLSGTGNLAGSLYSSVTGGFRNQAYGNGTHVGGGGENTTSSGSAWSFIGSGYSNSIINNGYGAISGGYNNDVTGAYGSVGGGRDNEASGENAAISGGRNNTAGGESSTASGYNNTASGKRSLSIGDSNIAGGSWSCALGRTANAAHDGSFVWADSTAGSPASTQDDQVTFQCGGGFRIVPRPSPPPTPVAGTMYMDSGDGNKLKVFDGSTWHAMW